MLTEPCKDVTIARLGARVEELDLNVAFGLNEMTMALAGCNGDMEGRTWASFMYEVRASDVCV